MKIITAFSLVLLLAVMLASPAYAESLQVSTADAGGAKGSTVTVPVTVSGASNLGSMDLFLAYDPAVLSASGVTKGALNKGIATANTSTQGLVVISLADSAGMTGSGEVAIVSFTVIGNATQTSPLGLQSVSAYDATTFLDIPVSTASGTFTVKEGAAAATATPAPGAGSESLILSAVIGLTAAVALAGRRK